MSIGDMTESRYKSYFGNFSRPFSAYFGWRVKIPTVDSHDAELPKTDGKCGKYLVT